MSDEVVKNAFVCLDPTDNIIVCVKAVKKGQQILHADKLIEMAADISVGHKLCILPISAGGKIIKYGASIGSALKKIEIGDHVHIHNIKSDYIDSNVR